MSNKSLILLQQENLEFKKENEALKETLTKLLQEIDRLRNLPNLPINPNQLVLTIEQRIIEDQIQLYQHLSHQGILSIDDIRALDLLIKNKRLLEKTQPIEPDYIKLSDDESDLLRIAGNVEIERPIKTDKSKASKKNPVA